MKVIKYVLPSGDEVVLTYNTSNELIAANEAAGGLYTVEDAENTERLPSIGERLKALEAAMLDMIGVTKCD